MVDAARAQAIDWQMEKNAMRVALESLQQVSAERPRPSACSCRASRMN
jgi:hypothetical protein